MSQVKIRHRLWDKFAHNRNGLPVLDCVLSFTGARRCVTQRFGREKPGEIARKAKGDSTMRRRGHVAIAAIMLSLAILTPVSAADDAATAYLREVESRIVGSWHLPPNSDGLKITLRFHLARDGTVSSVRIEGSSGNPRFDNSALMAMRLASPFRPPPESFRDGEQLLVLAPTPPAQVKPDRRIEYYLYSLGLAAFLLSALTGHQNLGLFVPPIVPPIVGGLWFLFQHSDNPGVDSQGVAITILALVALVIPVSFAVSLAGSLVGIWVRDGVKWCLKKV